MGSTGRLGEGVVAVFLSHGAVLVAVVPGAVQALVLLLVRRQLLRRRGLLLSLLRCAQGEGRRRVRGGRERGEVLPRGDGGGQAATTLLSRPQPPHNPVSRPRFIFKWHLCGWTDKAHTRENPGK